MILKLNRLMRKLVFVLGAAVAIYKLCERKTNSPKDQHEEYRAEEFDDIW